MTTPPASAPAMQVPETINLLQSLHQGVRVETVPVFNGIAPTERLTFHMTRCDKDKGVYQFNVLLLGIVLGQVAAKITPDDKLIWQRIN